MKQDANSGRTATFCVIFTQTLDVPDSISLECNERGFITVNGGNRRTTEYGMRRPAELKIDYFIPVGVTDAKLVRITEQTANGYTSMPVKRSGYQNGIVYAKLYEMGTYTVDSFNVFKIPDVKGKWMEDAANAMRNRAIAIGTAMTGKSYTVLFSPNQVITRAELYTLFMRYTGLGQYGMEYYKPYIERFADWDTFPEWSKYYIDIARQTGFAKGGENGNFNPNEQVTRREMFKLTFRIMSRLEMFPKTFPNKKVSFIDLPQTSGDYYEVSQLAKIGIIKGCDGYVNLDKTVTRGEFIQILYNILLHDMKNPHQAKIDGRNPSDNA